jgi:hypothetical protein
LCIVVVVLIIHEVAVVIIKRSEEVKVRMRKTKDKTLRWRCSGTNINTWNSLVYAQSAENRHKEGQQALCAYCAGHDVTEVEVESAGAADAQCEPTHMGGLCVALTTCIRATHPSSGNNHPVGEAKLRLKDRGEDMQELHTRKRGSETEVRVQ